MAPLVEFMISKSTDGFSFSGEENLQPNQHYLLVIIEIFP